MFKAFERPLTRHVVGIAFLVWISTAGFAGYPTEGEDPITATMRAWFKESSVLSKRDVNLLVGDKAWDCWSRRAGENKYMDDEGSFPVSFREHNGILRSSGFGIVVDEGNRLNFDAFAFADRGLLGSIAIKNRIAQISLRMTKWGDLVMEHITENPYPQDFKYMPSLTNTNSKVFSYGMCTRGHIAAPEIVGIPGRCHISDDRFNSEEGGCLDFSSGQVWSMSPPFDNMTYENASSYCKSLVEGGKNDWDLPQQPDLKSAASENGAVEHFRFNVSRRYWASSVGNTPTSVWVELSTGRGAVTEKSQNSGSVACKRQPLDRDKDGIPDTSDKCANTERGHATVKTGVHKGCSELQIQASQIKGA